MKAVSVRFRSEMEQAITLVELIGSARDLAKVDIRAFRSQHAVADHVRTVHAAALAFASTPIAYDGIYLAICGRFEFTVRELIERFIELAMTAVPSHSHLPAAIRDWHSQGTADIILRIREERFRHLTVTSLVGNLASCQKASVQIPYKLTPEAYSYNDRNFRATEIDELLTARLGLKKIWQKLARDPQLIAWSGASHHDTVENLCRQRLNNCMERRNAIVHRGRAYYTPGASEVIECAQFFTVLIDSFADVLTVYKASL